MLVLDDDGDLYMYVHARVLCGFFDLWTLLQETFTSLTRILV